MFKRRLLLWWLGMALLMLGVWAAWLQFSQGHAISPDAYQRIRRGMTQEDVQTLVGFPAGYYCKRGREGLPVVVESEGDTTPSEVRWAGSNDCWIIVWLDDHKLVIGKCRCMMNWDYWEPPTFTERLRDWLGW